MWNPIVSNLLKTSKLTGSEFKRLSDFSPKHTFQVASICKALSKLDHKACELRWDVISWLQNAGTKLHFQDIFSTWQVHENKSSLY